MADDPGIPEHGGDAALAEADNRGRIESGEVRAKGIPLAQHRDPGQTGLEPLERQLLEERGIRYLRPTPFDVVVADIEVVLPRPFAPPAPIGAGHQILHPSNCSAAELMQ